MTAVLAATNVAEDSVPALTRDQQLSYLQSAKVVRSKVLGQGITNSVRATLEANGFTHDAHIQTIDEFKQQFQGRMGTEVNFKDTYKFNIAASILDQLLDLNMIPLSVERMFEGKTAAFTWWVDNAVMTEMDRSKKKLDPPDPFHWNKQMWVLRVFDQLIANTDRNLGNVVITGDWDLWMIDHTRAFRIRHELQDARNLERCDRFLLERLRRLDRATVEPRLKPYLTGLEIDGLFARRDRIVAFFDQKVKELGENRVLFEYLEDRKAKYGK